LGYCNEDSSLHQWLDGYHAERCVMHCGMDTQAANVQTALAEDSYSGHFFVFRGALWRSCQVAVE